MRHLISDTPWMALAAVLVFGIPRLVSGLGRRWGWPVGFPSVMTQTLYVGAYTLVWAFADLGLIPGWVEAVAQAGVIIAYLIAPNDDDDDHRKRKGRLRSAWKRTREYLAQGIAAPRPAET